MMENVVISNPKELEKAKRTISESGAEKLHVVSDFDRTLTTAFVEGKKITSLLAILRDGNYLIPDYAKRAHELYDKYHPIEMDPQIPLEEKKKAMHEWWTTHFDLLIKSGLNKKDLEKVVETGEVKFRDGFEDFIDFLKEHNIPLLIISSSGLGGDAISMYLEREGKLYENVHIISNTYKWDEKGNAVGVKEPIIHVMNKDETTIQDFPVFEAIKDRKNVLLLGDTLDDVGMVQGLDYKNLIKIGFLNENEKENLERYKRNFDIVILHDGSMRYINGLLRDIIE
jgi:HAD superfamily hydrolase (TIGR01544 family)